MEVTSALVVIAIAFVLGYAIGIRKRNPLLQLLGDPIVQAQLGELQAMCRARDTALQEKRAASAIYDPLFEKRSARLGQLSPQEQEVEAAAFETIAASDDDLIRAYNRWNVWHSSNQATLARYGDVSELRRAILARTDPPVTPHG